MADVILTCEPRISSDLGASPILPLAPQTKKKHLDTLLYAYCPWESPALMRARRSGLPNALLSMPPVPHLNTLQAHRSNKNEYQICSSQSNIPLLCPIPVANTLQQRKQRKMSANFKDLRARLQDAAKPPSMMICSEICSKWQLVLPRAVRVASSNRNGSPSIMAP
jgi:hypothetical protein